MTLRALESLVHRRSAWWASLLVATILLAALGARDAVGQDCAGMLSISSEGSYVAIPTSPGLELTDGFTIEVWAQASSSLHHLAGLLEKGDSALNFYGILLDTNHHALGKTLLLSGPPALRSGTIDSVEGWHHYAF